MKTPKIFFVLSLIVSLGLLTQCEKYGGKGGMPEPDPDSDRPEWAGGNTDANDHIKGNDDSGTTRGGDYGDLYILLRDGNGVPEMTQIGDEWYVQPITEDGSLVELNDEGEVVNPEEAQEVEFGRLNIVRSPTSVLDQALEEALKVLAPANNSATISLDFCGRLTSHYYNEDLGELVDKTIDSPRENMAIYRTIMQDITDERLSFLWAAPYNYNPLSIAASCFAAGSDKTGTVDVDEVVYINGFMECTGNNPVLNEHDFDFSHEQNYYYNFSEPMDGQPQYRFNYNRNVYLTRFLKIITINGDGTYSEDIVNVLDAMESRGLFTERWDEMDTLTPAELFAKAVDDAVQVLDFVHGDSNIEFLPGYTP